MVFSTGQPPAFCLIGAVNDVGATVTREGGKLATRLTREIALTIGQRAHPSLETCRETIINYNDRPFTHHGDVLRVLRKTRARLAGEP